MTAIVPIRKSPTMIATSLILLGFVIVGCSSPQPVKTIALQPPPKAVSPTPTIFLSPSPYPGGAIWLSPSLPAGMVQTWDEEILQQNGFEVVVDEDKAVVKVMPGAGEIISTWVYVLVAPFPTVTDGMTWEELQLRWSGQEGNAPLLVSRSSLLQLETLLGPAGENVRVAPQGQLLEIAWDAGSAYALIPFEALEPRWKVLALEGQAPIRKDFDLAAYSLKVSIGVDGPEGAYQHLSELLDIPLLNYDPGKMTVLVMTGVTALTRATAWQMDRRGVAFPAEKIGDWLVEADLTHISNEVVFTDDCPLPDPTQEGLKFCSNPANIELLEIIGADIIELTGNHVRDYGSEALAFTLSEYRARGWGIFGGGETLEDSFQPYRVEHNGTKLAFIGCNQAGPKYAWAFADQPGSTPCEAERILREVQRLVKQDYQVIFTYQWGEDNVVMEDQRKAFEAAVDAGAIIVNGSQAHQPLAMSFYKDGFIHYGLGNLFFDQMQTLRLRSEILDRHVFYAGRHISTELLTAMLESYAQPRPMTPEERSVLLGEIFEDSDW